MVIGIDGVPYELLSHFAAKGIMPNVARLIKKYQFKQMAVPLPEISAVSWTSFMTGMNPGEHGIYGFMELNRQNYQYTFPSFRALPVKTVWEHIALTDKRSVIINLPNTYPVRPIKGTLIAGFVAPDLEKSVYPSTFYPQLKAMRYKTDVDAQLGKDNKELFLKELQNNLDQLYRVYKKLSNPSQWELFFFIITGTDRLNHFLFHALEDTRSPYHKDCLDYYRHVDQLIQEVVSEMETQGIPFIILSDHGFVKIKQEVYLSHYLKQWGYLECGPETPGSLQSISAASRAFVLDPSRVYLHMQDKYARGTVKPSEYHILREELKTKFLALEINGEPVIKKVFYPEDIFSGDYLANAPDLILLSYYGYDLKSGITRDQLYGQTHFTGMHAQDNALLIDAVGFSFVDQPHIVSLGQHIRHFFER